MNEYSRIMTKSSDIARLLNSLASVGWKTTRAVSVNRLLYLAAVLYSFVNNNEVNIFKDDYRFAITLRGPEDSEIENALINLESNEAVYRNNDGFSLNKDSKYNYVETDKEKKERWFDVIAFIVALYGEDKLYDFIFRDAEYRNAVKGNSLYNLNIGSDNDTVKFLNGFKKDFENALNVPEDNLDNKQYLELYFEYIFGKILRGEQL